MTTTRRQFLQASATGAASVIAACQSLERQPEPLNVLVLGGTGFIGPHLVERCLAHGHSVTLFNRGRTNPQLFPECEKLIGDRNPDKDQGVQALLGRSFDVVFDDCGYYPRHVKATAEILGPSARSYVYVSSISCYARNDAEGLDEDAELATMPDPTLESMGANYEHYGALKALCEQAAETAVPGRTAIVRPGYIVGPGDPTGRFTYWPARAQRGGTMLVPGTPSDPIQVIDVRDLADFMLRIAERRVTGRFNACGPEQRLAWGRVIEAACELASAKPSPRWATLEELAELGPVEFPIWAPHEGETKGFHTWSNARAVAAGLRFRSIEEISADTLAWWQALPEDDRGKELAGPDAETEADLLDRLG